jgi:hypothetical protein
MLASSLYSNPLNSNDTWASFIRQNKGPSNTSPGLSSLPHPARRLLQHLATNGVPVVLTTEPWSLQRRDDAMARGSHVSTKEHEVFLRVEMNDMVSKGFWIVLPYSQVRSLPGLREKILETRIESINRCKFAKEFLVWRNNNKQRVVTTQAERYRIVNHAQRSPTQHTASYESAHPEHHDLLQVIRAELY